MSEYIYKRERIADGVYTAESTGEEIVRCRDCVHFDAYGNTFGWCAFHDIDCSERRYCAWAERKEGGDGIPD